jgi:transcriptional regulator with XRE-family HTH domain
MKPPSLADRLRELMQEQRPPLTLSALADRVGVTPGAVNGWLNGTIPYPRTLNRICLALGVRRDWLLYGDGKKQLPAEALARIQEMPATYGRHEKLRFIEENRPEILPMVDAFLESAQKQTASEGGDKPGEKSDRSLHPRDGGLRTKRAAR